MPVCWIRGMSLNAEAGKLPHSRLYGATSTRSESNIYIIVNDSEFEFSVTLFPLLKINSAYYCSAVGYFTMQAFNPEDGYDLIYNHQSILYETYKLTYNKRLGFYS